MQKYIYFQYEMAPVEHAASILQRDLNNNPAWELVTIVTLNHVMNANSKVVTGSGKPQIQVVQMACPIYKVKEEDSEKLPKAPRGVDKDGNIIIGPDIPPKHPPVSGR